VWWLEPTLAAAPAVRAGGKPAPHRRAVFVELEKEEFFQKLWK
jgi:hypothetical protein